jgi:predicted PurR-regulated permease PerM
MYGSRINLVVFLVILSVYWSAIIGPIGPLLGVPLTMATKELVLDIDPRDRWIGHFMNKEARYYSEEKEL